MSCCWFQARTSHLQPVCRQCEGSRGSKDTAEGTVFDGSGTRRGFSMKRHHEHYSPPSSLRLLLGHIVPVSAPPPQFLTLSHVSSAQWLLKKAFSAEMLRVRHHPQTTSLFPPTPKIKSQELASFVLFVCLFFPPAFQWMPLLFGDIGAIITLLM